VRVRMAFLDVMARRSSRPASGRTPAPSNELPVDLGLFGQAVLLQFQVEVLRPKRLFEPINRRARPGQLVSLDALGIFAGQAAGESDEPFLVRRQQFFVDARLVVITSRWAAVESLIRFL